MDRGSLHYLLLQSILELKTEFNTKADKLISLLNSGFEKDSSVEISGRWLQSQREKQNCSSLSSPHVEYGLRWDAQDFLVESEANISAPPPLFKTKPDKPSKSNKQSTLSLKKNHGSDSFNLLTEFNAFRQQKYGSVHSITQPLPELRENVQEKPVGNASQLDRDKTILVTESAKPVKPNWRSSLTMKKSKWADSPRNSTYRSSGDNFNINRCVSFQREVQNKRENVQQRPPNDVSPIASEISSSESLSMYSTDANVSTDSFDSEHLQEFMSEVKGSGPGLSKLRESVVVKPQTSMFNVSEIDALPPPEMHTLVNRSVLFKPKESAIDVPKNSSNVTLSRSTPQNIQQPTFQSLAYDLFSYVCLIPAFDSKGRRIELDDFNETDFQGISFSLNGLHPKSLFITVFDVLMAGIYTACIAVVPFIVGFTTIIPETYGVYFSVIFTVAYCIDSLVTLLTPHSKVGRTVIYSTREYEALRPYLRDWLRHWAAKYLIPDIISTIPYGLIFGPSFTSLRLLRLIRVLRLGQITGRCAYFTRLRLLVEGKVGVGAAKIIPIGIGIFVFLHYNACLIYFSGEVNGFVGWNQYWLQTQTESLWDSYLWCFVMAVGNMFPMSYKPQTKLEQFMAIIFIFVGAGLYAVLVGYISSAAISVDNSGRLYNQKMEELKDYITWRQLNNETKDKLISYYETKYRGKYFEEDTLLGDMNEALRTEISLHNTLDLITKVPFLRRQVGDGRDDIFYARIASVLHIRYYIPGDCVTREGESGTDMFFILSGKLDVLIGGEVRKSLYDGAYFGEVALINRVLRTATVQARMPSVLYRLTFQDFHAVINEFDDMKVRVSDLAFERELVLKKGDFGRY